MLVRSLIVVWCAAALLGCPKSSDPVAAPDVSAEPDVPGGDTKTPTDTGEKKVCEPAPAQGDPAWQVLTVCEPGEILSVWAAGRNEVWTAGARGSVMRFDGCEWTRPDPGVTADLWWVFAFEGEPAFFSGSDGTVLRYLHGEWDTLKTDTTATIFGMWGASAADLWAVGFDPVGDAGSVLMRFDGKYFESVALPDEAPDDPDLFKVWGTGPNDVWIVGRNDVILHWDGEKLRWEPSGTDGDWVTVTGVGDTVVIVGGKSNGQIVERSGGVWTSKAPDFVQPLQGVCLQPDGTGLATGMGATFLRRGADGVWIEDWDVPFDIVDPNDPPVAGCFYPTPDYHACASDGTGGFFATGGHFIGPIDEGALLYYGPPLPTEGL